MHYKSPQRGATPLIDDYRHKGMRQQLINELLRKGISDKKVLQAMSIVPRHFMLDKAFSDWAYKDMAFPIDAEQTISMPYTVALQSQLLQVKKGDKILEVGTGSGYQAAVLYQMGAKVYSIERQEKLFKKTSVLLQKMGMSGIRTLFGDGYAGAPRFAPFDKVIVTAGASTVPQALLSQLKIGGIMVLPLEGENGQEMMRYIKTTESSCKRQNHGPCAFVPMLSGTNR